MQIKTGWSGENEERYVYDGDEEIQNPYEERRTGGGQKDEKKKQRRMEEGQKDEMME
ncbi:hypothetical protein KIN20_016511 [Parelaphostrongylus tenuis]|uniref:Uncharacterized protein n=1 Tax=Parelaphostrongylus tenuis TaxID=148309 RepID=A0AAD5MYM7_PARTN|nr:hypothetical protein KIN20_016511 [Parelaphostrongylus tenuis]